MSAGSRTASRRGPRRAGPTGSGCRSARRPPATATTPGKWPRSRRTRRLLTGYHDAVFEHTIRYVGTLTDADLPVVVDESWDPPVTLGVRLVSVISDDLQHVGQAAFIRGFLLRQ